MTLLAPFHLAIPVSNLDEAKNFYEDKLECKPGRFTKEWADYSFFGHQLVLHEDINHNGQKHFNEVDGKNVPIPQGSSLEIMQGNKIVVESVDTVTAKSDVNNSLDVALTIMEIT